MYGDESWIPQEYEIAGETRVKPSAYSSEDNLVGEYKAKGYTDKSMTREGKSGYVDVEDVKQGAARPETVHAESAGAGDTGAKTGGAAASGGGQ